MATMLVIGVAFLGMGNGACFQVVPQTFRTELGVATGLIGAFGGLGGFFLPTLLGSVKQISHSYTLGWLVLSGFALLALTLLRILMARDSGWRTSWVGTVEAEAVESEQVEVVAGEA
jgi:NNP family nitrate/nitrite transporter-like MFS transporter